MVHVIPHVHVNVRTTASLRAIVLRYPYEQMYVCTCVSPALRKDARENRRQFPTDRRVAEIGLIDRIGLKPMGRSIVRHSA